MRLRSRATTLCSKTSKGHKNGTSLIYQLDYLILPPSSPSRKWKLRQSLKNEVETRELSFRKKYSFFLRPCCMKCRERETVSGNHAVTEKAGSCISILVETSWLINWNSQILTLISNWFDMVLFFVINRKLIVCRTFNFVIFWRLQFFSKYLSKRTQTRVTSNN